MNSNKNNLKRLTLFIKGQVRKTGMRGIVMRGADGFALAGRVRNNEDGTVGVIVEGPEKVRLDKQGLVNPRSGD